MINICYYCSINSYFNTELRNKDSAHCTVTALSISEDSVDYNYNYVNIN